MAILVCVLCTVIITIAYSCMQTNLRRSNVRIVSNGSRKMKTKVPYWGMCMYLYIALYIYEDSYICINVC